MVVVSGWLLVGILRLEGNLYDSENFSTILSIAIWNVRILRSSSRLFCCVRAIISFVASSGHKVAREDT